MSSGIIRLFLLSCYFFILPARSLPAQGIIELPMSDYQPAEAEQDGKWDLMEVGADHPTRYSLETGNDSSMYIKAVSRDAASGLIYRVDIDPGEYPVMEWSWKIDGVLSNGDMFRRRGDDYAARVYLTFEYDRSRLRFGEKLKLWSINTFTSREVPLRSVNYIWANKAVKGTLAPSPFTGWVQMIAVRSGNTEAGDWITERRNILLDYRDAFGESPGRITAVVIMTDSDNSGGTASASYGNIRFLKRK